MDAGSDPAVRAQPQTHGVHLRAHPSRGAHEEGQLNQERMFCGKKTSFQGGRNGDPTGNGVRREGSTAWRAPSHLRPFFQVQRPAHPGKPEQRTGQLRAALYGGRSPGE